MPKDVVKEEDLSKALNDLEEIIKSCGKGKEEKEEQAKEKKEEDTEKSEMAKCTCGNEKCTGNCSTQKSESSVASEIAKSEAITKSVEVSDFLKDLVNIVEKSLTDSRNEIIKSVEASENALKEQKEINVQLVKSLQALAENINTLADRQTEIEKQPVQVKKSVTAVAVDRPIAKSGDEKEVRLSKAEVSGKLTDMVMKSETVNGVPVTMHDVTKFEATGQLRPELQKALSK